MRNIGIISGTPTTMADSKYHNGDTNKQSISGIDTLLEPLNRHLNINFLTLYKKQMAELKVVWIVTNLLGWPIYVLSVYQNIENAKAVVLIVLGAIFMLVKIWQAYEKGRTTKIANDRQKFELDCEKMDRQQKRVTQKEQSHEDIESSY
jgi:predicted membrane protein